MKRINKLLINSIQRNNKIFFNKNNLKLNKIGT